MKGVASAVKEKADEIVDKTHKKALESAYEEQGMDSETAKAKAAEVAREGEAPKGEAPREGSAGRGPEQRMREDEEEEIGGTMHGGERPTPKSPGVGRDVEDVM